MWYGRLVGNANRASQPLQRIPIQVLAALPWFMQNTKAQLVSFIDSFQLKAPLIGYFNSHGSLNFKLRVAIQPGIHRVLFPGRTVHIGSGGGGGGGTSISSAASNCILGVTRLPAPERVSVMLTPVVLSTFKISSMLALGLACFSTAQAPAT